MGTTDGVLTFHNESKRVEKEPFDVVAERFAALFRGSVEAYGTEKGGCVRAIPDVQGHLTNGEPIGIYPIRKVGVGLDTKWGCVDIDITTEQKPGGDVATEEEAHAQACNIQTALRLEGITSWIEITRSRGRHVWVFAEDWMPAAIIRRALIVACRLAGASEREVNPKQETLAEGQLGNYVRLPYVGRDVPFTLEPGIRYTRVMVKPDGTKYTLREFLAEAVAALASVQDLTNLAALYKEPPRPTHFASDKTPEVDRELTKRLGGLAWTIFCNGPIEGRDRSSTLMRLAHLCREDRLTPDEALAIVFDADGRWGKFYDRADGEQRMTSMVERAYAGWEG